MPAGGALFGGSGSGPGSTGGVKHLVEMRAGKMNLKGGTVYPDKRKGLLYVYQSEDSLMHFCWQDRTTGIVEDDLIIFPDDCEYLQIPQCTSGRAYLLKFKSSNRRFFFWLQEPRTDRDEEHCKRINEYLNNPPGNVPATSSADQDLQSLLNNMSQSQLIQLFGGVGQIGGGLSNLLGTMSRPSTGSSRGSSTPVIAHRAVPSTPTTAATTTTSQGSAGLATPQNASVPTTVPSAPKRPTASQRTDGEGAAESSKAIQLADLQSFLLGLQPPPQGESSSTTGVDLSTALTGDALTGMLGNEDVVGQLQGHLPAVDGNVQEQLRSTLASPQFQQAVSQFSSALESGQLGPVVSQLAVNPEAVAAAAQGNMQEFVKALEKNEEEKAGDQKSPKKAETGKDPNKKDDDEGMQLD